MKSFALKGDFSQYKSEPILPPLSRITVEELNNLPDEEKEQLTVSQYEYLAARRIFPVHYAGRIFFEEGW